jgi:hypothetical protein
MAEDTKNVRQRSYLNRDFDSLRRSMVKYARDYYGGGVQDFSEVSLQGVLVDMAAAVGDNLSFYLDHQFTELDADTAVELVNVERMLNLAGVPIAGAAAATVRARLTVEVPAEFSPSQGAWVPAPSALPLVQEGSVFSAANDTVFTLVADADFRLETAEKKIGQVQAGSPRTFFVTLPVVLVSGGVTTESFPLPASFSPFRKITLSQRDVSEIIKVYDDLGNTYYGVTDLSQDTVFVPVSNVASDSDQVADNLRLVPAPYRYTKSTSLASRSTVLTLGGGSAQTFEDDVIPDPSDVAFRYTYRTSMPVSPFDPNSLLGSKTLGVSAVGTNLNVTYRHGGGLSHNVAPGTLTSVVLPRLSFPGNPALAASRAVRSSLAITNPDPALGGEDAPTVEDLRSLIPAYRSSQSRIVTKEDLLARVYTLPSNFGRVYRAGIRNNPRSPLSTQLFILSRDSEGKLSVSPDTLKKNLRNYLNPYRIVSDSIDILDAPWVNVRVDFEVIVDSTFNRQLVLAAAVARLKKFFLLKNFNVDQPIVLSDVSGAIYGVNGIVSVGAVTLSCLTGLVNNRSYGTYFHNMASNTKKGIVFPPDGGMFEVRYPDYDIVGKSST